MIDPVQPTILETSAAIDAARRAVEVARASGDGAGAARALAQLGRLELARYDHPQAAEHLDAALAGLAADAPPAERCELQLSRAENLFRLNDYRASLAAAQDALQLATTSGDRLRVALALEASGAACAQLSSYQHAVGHLHEALGTFEAIGCPELGGRTLNYLGVVHEEVGEMPRALAHYERALEMVRRAGQRDMEARVLANLGEAFVNERDYARAFPYLVEARALAERLGEHNLCGWILEATGRAHAARDERAPARVCFEQALDEHNLGHSKRHRAEAYASLGRFLADDGLYTEAVAHLQRALELHEEVHVQRELYRVHFWLAEVHQRFGDSERAFEHFRAYDRIHSAVLEDVARAKVTAVTSEFELERTRRERVLVDQKNTELAQAYHEQKQLNNRLEAQARELRELSVRDSLTGIHNRRYFDQRMAGEWERARRYRNTLAVALADIDGFKRVNDRFGHALGDEVLRVVARLATGLVRQSDVLARYGGEEFAFLFPQIDDAAAQRASEKIREAVATYPWRSLAPDLAVTISIGVASGAELESWEKLLALADHRLYAAKTAGRNRVVVEG